MKRPHQWHCYGWCYRCPASPGEPCLRINSLPRHRDPTTHHHQGRPRFLASVQEFRMVPVQCTSRHWAYGLRCALGVHPGIVHYSNKLDSLIWTDDSVPAALKCRETVEEVY